MLRPDSEETDDEPEVIAVNSVFELHRLLAVPGALEKVLGTVRAVRPRIVTVAEQDANHNTGSFSDRFSESLDYYYAMFEALAEVYLNQQICNVVACEGTERHETLGQWRDRLLRAGFEPHRLGSHVREHAASALLRRRRVQGRGE
jgi:DELLA protein